MVRILIASRSQKCPTQWKKYLSVDSNKLELAEFFVKEWTRQKYAERLRHGLFCVTHEQGGVINAGCSFSSLLLNCCGQVLILSAIIDEDKLQLWLERKSQFLASIEDATRSGTVLHAHGLLALTGIRLPPRTFQTSSALMKKQTHARHTGLTGYASVVIRSPDTDVAILARSILLPNSFSEQEINTRSRYIDIQAM